MTSKMEVGVLALLWCQGTKREKAEFLANLVQQDKEKDISWKNKDLLFMFEKLFYYSYDMTLKYSTNMMETSTKQYSICDEDVQNMRMQHRKYQDYFYEEFCDLVFSHECLISRKHFINQVSHSECTYLFNADHIR